ncbi:MAG TPA: hypothetical protein VF544_04260 [Pyrinomonadaceae bacterium]|jgi:hypothetical protein
MKKLIASSLKTGRASTVGLFSAIAKKQILCNVLLAIFCFALASPGAAQSLSERPQPEYANDLSELRLRRVYVYSADPVSRQNIVKELRRERGLLDIVERAEEADFLILYEGPMGEGADPFAAAAGMGSVTATGTLVAYRLIESCGGVRTRILYATRKAKTVYGGIPVPLTPLNRVELAQNEFNPRPFSTKRLGAELAARGVLFGLGKLFPSIFRANPIEGTVSLSFSGSPEHMVVAEFLKRVKEARKGEPPSYAGLAAGRPAPLAVDSEPSALLTAPAAAPGRLVPCQPKSLLPARSDYGQGVSSDVNPGYDFLPAPSPAPRPLGTGRADSDTVPQ